MAIVRNPAGIIFGKERGGICVGEIRRRLQLQEVAVGVSGKGGEISRPRP